MDLVTGATGFIGGAVARKLREGGVPVRILVREGVQGAARREQVDQLVAMGAEVVHGDVTDERASATALRGVRRVFHLAALYQFWGAPAREYRVVNVQATTALLAAAKREGVERFVHCSTVGTLAVSKDARPVDETRRARPEELCGEYKRTKFEAEEASLAAAREGAPVIVVNPSAPVGPHDVKPTPTGQMVVDFLKGRMFGYTRTGLNLVDVDDVAVGHILAAEKGRIGERYILGNRNLWLKEIFDLLAGISGVKSPRLRVPHVLVSMTAWFEEGAASLFPKRVPRVTRDQAKMARHPMFFDCAKAVRELGLPQTPIEESLRRAVEWFRKAGYAP